MNLVRLAVRNPVAVNIVMVAVIGVGLYSWNSLRREFFPNIDPDQVFITVAWPGATPEEVEKAIVRRIERELRDLDEVEEVRSNVLEGVAAITVVLEDDADRDRVLNDVRSAIDKVEPDLPVDSEDPEVIESRPLLPVISVVVYGTAGEGRLREVAKDVRDDLLDFPGISRITLSGLREREIWVEVIPEKLEEYGLTLEEVGSVLARSNLDLPGGQLKGERGNIRIRTLGEKERARELEMTLVRSVPDGGSIRLRDVARVRETFEDKVEHGRFQGQSAVMVTVFKTPEQDALKIASMAKDYVQKSVLPYGDEIKLATTTDLSRFIAQRLDLMLRNARLGILLVVLVLAVFLELRVALWVSVGLFISFLGGFYVMELLGASINLISLFGLIVVLGLLVDDAIVVGERIFTRRREGMEPEEAAVRGTTEVAGPVTIAVLTTIIAFLPLAFMGGRLGAMMGVLPIVVISALTVSLLEAFTILPAHLAHSKKRKGRFRERLERFGEIRHRFFERRLPDLLEGSLRFAFRWRYVTLAAAAGLFLITMGLVAGGVVKVVFLPRTDAETVVLDLEMAAGTPAVETMAVVEELEALAHAAPEVKSIFSVVGTSFSDRGRQTPADPATIGQITLELVAAEDRRGSNLRHSEKLIDQLRRDARFIPGVRRLAISARGGIGGSDIEVRLRGDDMDTLRTLTAELREELGSYKGVTQIQDDLAEGKMEIRFRLRDDARSLGLTTREVARQVRHALFGFEVQDLQDEDEEVTVRVLLPEENRTGLDDLARVRIATPEGGRVPLEEAVDLTTTRGFASLYRVDGKRAVHVRAEVDADQANVNEINTELTPFLDALVTRYPGAAYSYEGQKKEARESLSALRLGFPAALLAIYALIAALFRSYLQPLIVMAAIPISLIGVVVGHGLLGFDLTLLSMIGTVALAGIVVNDSLILMDFVNRHRAGGKGALESVVAGCRARLRPILLTTITTIAGLSPLMLEKSFQAQFLIPMAISIVFGLAFATVLTLVIIPSGYLVVVDIRRSFRWIFTGHWRPEVDA